jgi:WD40 repeat protein
VIAGVAFSPDGARVVSGSSDGTVRVWSDLEPLPIDDPRLWRATNDCLSTTLRKQLLGVDDAVATALRDRCVARVAAQRTRP